MSSAQMPPPRLPLPKHSGQRMAKANHVQRMLPKPTTSGPTEADASDKTCDVDDKSSVNGNFGWMTMDSANIPCLFRSNVKFVSVRMVEQKLLSKYPSTYPEELSKRSPLVSQFITNAEAKLLNEINVEHCACEFGPTAFTEKDLVVSWNDFVEFYKIVKKYFPNQSLEKKQTKTNLNATGGGWVQINNTVVPYVRRLAPSGKEVLRLAPLPVIKYAANLLKDVAVPNVKPLESECETLTVMCRGAGLDFTFAIHNTPMILLTLLPVYSDVPITMKRLPDNDPFSSAEYCPNPEVEDNQKNTSSADQRRATVLPPTSMPLLQLVGHHTSKLPSYEAAVKSPLLGPAHRAATLLPPAAHSGPTAAKRPRTSTAVQLSSPLVTPITIAPVLAPNMPATTRGAAPLQGLLPINFVMPPPGMVHGAQGVWRPRPDNPDDMKKLAKMMNMQAAILSQTGALSARNPVLTSLPISTPVGMPSLIPVIASSTPSAFPRTASPTPNRGVKIKPITFHNRRVSCLVKEGSKQQFALVEAVSRVYFPMCSLDDFMQTITRMLNISVYQLNREEENGFIRFYGLQTKTLRCNKVINLRDLDEHMPQLYGIFRKADNSETQPETMDLSVSKKNTTPDAVNSFDLLPRPPSRESETSSQADHPQPLDLVSTNKETSVVPSGQPAITERNNNESTGVLGALGVKSHVNRSSKAGGLSKLSRLEDAVNRLHKNKLKEIPNGESGVVPVMTPATDRL